MTENTWPIRPSSTARLVTLCTTCKFLSLGLPAAALLIVHSYFNYNYGQFTTLWDRLGGSYRKPNEELFRKETKMAADEWNRQAKEMERIQKEVEGEDDRQYSAETECKKVQ